MQPRRKTQPPLASRRIRKPEVRMPAERDRHRPAAERHDRGVDAELRISHRSPRLDAMRERELGRVDVDRRAQLAPCRRGSRAGRPTSPAPTSSPWIGKPVVVDAEATPGEVDVHARGAVPPPREPVGPRCEQRQARCPAGPQRVEPAGEREVLRAAAPQRHAGHTEPRYEDGRHRSRGQLDRGLTPEAAFSRTDTRRHRVSPSRSRPRRDDR